MRSSEGCVQLFCARVGPGGVLMRATRQEIKEATDDLRAKGVSVD